MVSRSKTREAFDIRAVSYCVLYVGKSGAHLSLEENRLWVQCYDTASNIGVRACLNNT
jgi:hypothetical protein